ncbi:MAG: aldehyde ferredoxin oxidoreductase family protein [Thermoplasmata archaeon]|nr:MAG: aldehyde ferredoxin oxidoreductase family protein [Thermoplasmata archaeon]
MSSKLGGYAGKILRVDLSKGKVKSEELSKEACIKYIGGRGRDAKVLFDELPINANPLGKENILCISTGPVTGLLGPTTGRVNAAAKSPLTDIYGNSNSGTNWGPELKYAGYDGLIITGKADKPVYLNIEDDLVKIKDAGRLWGEGVFETTLSLQEKYNGYETRVCAIGPGAERGVLFGSLIFDLWDAAARTGMGTVMASKNLKAIAVSGTGALEVADPKRYKEVIEDGWLGLTRDPGFKMGEHQALGTSVCVGWCNAQGWLPTRNFRESVFEGAENISGEEFRDKYSIKESPVPGGRACMSCPNRCKRFGRIDSGKYAGTRGNIEFEGVAAFGSKCGVDDLEAVFHAFMIANDYGIDCVSCGNMIATFMELNEEGIIDTKKSDGIDLRFGNAEAMVEMVHRIANLEGKLGKLGALGAAKATKKIGKGAERYTSCIKGIDTIACDPRAAKGFGFTFAVSSRGSDHLRAHPVFEMIGLKGDIGKELFGSEESCTLRGYKGKAKMVFWHENLSAVTDSIGSCRFMHASYYAQYPVPEIRAKYSKKKGKSDVHSIKYHKWLSAATGMDISYEDLLRTGDRIVNLERAINTRYGIRRKDDTLPQRFIKQPLPSGPAKGETFTKKQLEKIMDSYYELRGWDKATGLHLKEKLKELEMEDVLADLKKRKLVASSKKGKKGEKGKKTSSKKKR